MSDLNLSSVEAALERGDYGQSLQLLEALAEQHPLMSPDGPRLRLLMVTALMGQGQDDQALSTCRLLMSCSDPNLRQQARQLLTILEAPSLERPERWSIRLPKLEINNTGQSLPSPGRRKRARRNNTPAPPPTGPTRAPALGFAALVSAVLLAVTLLLSGCMRINADIELAGPDRLQMHWELLSPYNQALPWQQRFEQKVHNTLPALQIAHPKAGQQILTTAVEPSKALSRELQQLVALAGASSGVVLPNPELALTERNWIIGVQQRLFLTIDLTDLPTIPDLKINLSLDHGRVSCALQPGEQLELELHSWRWSGLGLGSIAIAVLLLVSLIFQSMRRKLYGFPSLPS